MEEDKEEEKYLREDKHQYLQQVKRLKSDNKNLQDSLVEFQDDHQILTNLLN